MAEWKVYHASGVPGFFTNAGEVLAKLRKVGGYKQVANVTAATLEDVYRLTNNIDCPWVENPGVEALHGQTRSTSVGDIIVDADGKHWLVAMMGFEELPL